MAAVGRRIRSLFRKEDGATSVLVVFFLGFFGLAFAALVIDASLLYAKRSAMITAADAGALAGANVIREQVLAGKSSTSPEVVDLAKAAARQFAVTNGADDSLTTVEISKRTVPLPNGTTENRQVVDVTVGVKESSIFARFMGDSENTVRATATGTWGYVYKAYVGNILPLFIFDSNYKINTLTYLHDLLETPVVPDPSNPDTNSYGYVQLTGSGKGDIKDALAGKYTGGLYMEKNILDGEPGKGNFVSGAIEERMTEAAKLGSVGERRSAMMGLVPVISWEKFKEIDSNFKSKYDKLASQLKLPIEYFAYMEITDVVKSSSNWGSALALNPFEDPNSLYKAVGSAGRRNYSAVVGAKPPADLIVGRFTGETVQARTLTEAGDQINPNPDGGPQDISAMYAKLIN